MEVILDQLRTTAANSIIFSLTTGEPEGADREFCHRLAGIVAQFDDDPHWENFMARALSHHADGDFESAVGMYVRARGSIEGDEHVRDDAAWRIRVGLIQDLEARATGRQPLPVFVSRSGVEPATGS